MNTQQIHKAAVAMTQTPMVRTMTDPQLVEQWRGAKSEGSDVMRIALEQEMERRGDIRTQASKYFKRFRDYCTEAQLERVSAKFELYGSLSVWAESELVARTEWGIN